MANRQNFTRPIKFEIAKRAMRPDGQMACEWCGAVGVRLELHHLEMDAMKSDEAKRKRNLTAADGVMICLPCHKPESGRQRGELARIEAAQERYLGVKNTPRQTIKSRGFTKSPRAPKRLSAEKQCAGLSALARQIVATGE